MERAWIIGDEFCYRTARKYFKGPKIEENKHALCTFNTFEVTEFVSSRYHSHNPSVLGRYVNNLVYVLNKSSTEGLPRLIVVVTDDDIVKNIKMMSTASLQIGILFDWLTKEFNKAIVSFRDYLPAKSKKLGQPHVLWISPPTHKYFGHSANKKRLIQSECLESIVKFQDNMSVLKMLKVWDENDSNLFVPDAYRFTTDGLCKYWMAVDSAIRYWNVALFPKLQQNRKNRSGTSKKGVKPNSRYSWRKDVSSRSRR